MIGVDTNLLVRYLAQDDTTQSPLASQIIDGFTPEAPGYISQVVLVETVRVLTRSYRMSREAVASVIETLLRAREIVVDRADAGYLALATYRATKADFSDALIAHGGLLAGCTETLTFDKLAADHAGMRLVSP
ncbi:PIN domain-containing protein [Sinorhizobium meliloti]|jgi:predicted nucleic-acid-binding protein|uniref:PIN domain-containing protein n=5 Tax=Rhizobium meliloti TaxID=382 RepID=Q92PV8_RHIME|nr:PIN domain-containing protein [Sinorhizobium meliloti]PST26072.1 PIN domain-containing protein [Mesorhizobium loti]TWB05006.1 putative nucleic-acid-binding protein [Ensifer sp. SEMIA 134]TWB35990.1 putative nucleic-acid-binding protein [Ensifer sp. SEMIA 135]AEG04280.1 hypothetical protein SinmeB_1359 [Sinorhizobium meliloti BL225C]AEG53257.1 hypothetical protein Sinme_1517 [Sinorhizobium meliloti AK83]